VLLTAPALTWVLALAMAVSLNRIALIAGTLPAGPLARGRMQRPCRPWPAKLAVGHRAAKSPFH